jgi:hypothetical protein
MSRAPRPITDRDQAALRRRARILPDLHWLSDFGDLAGTAKVAEPRANIRSRRDRSPLHNEVDPMTASITLARLAAGAAITAGAAVIAAFLGCLGLLFYAFHRYGQLRPED